MSDAAFTTAELRALTEAHLALTRYGNAAKETCLHSWPETLGAGCPVCALRTADGWDELIDRAHQALGVIIALAIAGRINVITTDEHTRYEVDPANVAEMIRALEG